MNINDELIEYIGDLSRLYLNDKEASKKDMTDILNYIDKLNELDTKDVPAMSHPFEVSNCFRDDIVTNDDKSEILLTNAPDKKPDKKGAYYKVFKAVE